MLKKFAGVRRPLFGLFGFSGSSNTTNQIDQINQMNQTDHPQENGLCEYPWTILIPALDVRVQW